MRTLILALACAAPLLAAAPAGAQVTIVPAVSTPATVSPSTAPAIAPAQPAASAPAGRWHQACDGDVRRFCGGETRKPAITACLDRNTDKLSPECKAIRADEEKRWREGRERRERPGRR